MTAVVIGVGNPHRRDDGVGPAVATLLAADPPAGVEVRACPAEPTAILEAWDGADLAVIVDAAPGGVPGRVRRCVIGDLAATAAVSSHDLSLPETYRLAGALGLAPASVVVIAVDIADTGHGTGLSAAVAAAVVPAAREVRAVLAGQLEEPAHQQP